MLDSNLNPWLIEVNHLPSFGTDSSLDKDIKERLMEQVFSVLPVLPDDQQAYMAHHKAESEKRLIAQRKRNTAAAKAEAEQAAANKNKPKPPVRPRDGNKKDSPKSDPAGMAASGAASGNGGPGDNSGSGGNGTGEGGIDEKKDGTAAEDDQSIYDEDCTPERLQEIKSILYDVYSKYSPEKLPKIDRLLTKYIGHEEEFLRFVFNKYNVSPTLYKPPVSQRKRQEQQQQQEEEAAAAAAATSEAKAAEDGGGEEGGGGEGGSGNDSGINSNGAAASSENADAAAAPGEDTIYIPKPVSRSGTGSSNNRMDGGAKRASRSMSPPRGSTASGSSRRAPASWRSSEQEDAVFRSEVFAAHVPKDADEWMEFETSRLTQFSRIFPLPKSQQPNASSSSSSSSSVAVQAIAVEAAGPDVDAASISSSGATNDLKKLPDDTSPSSSSSSSSIAKVAAFTNTTSAASAGASATSDEVVLPVDPVLAEKKRSLYQRTTGSIATRYQEYKLLIGSIYYLHCKHDLEAMSLRSSSGLILPVPDNPSSLSSSSYHPSQHTPEELRELALINEEERQCSAELLDLVGTYVGAASWLYFTKMPGAYSTDDWTAWFLHRVVRKCDNVALEEEQLVLNTNGAAAATAAGGERRDQGANKKSPTLSAADEHGWVLVGVSCESKQAPAFSRIKEEILVRRTREENSEQAAAATAGASKQPPPPPKPQQQQQQQRQDQNGGGASSNDNEEAQKEIRYHDQLTIVPAFALFLREPSPHHHEKEVLLVIRGTKSLADCLVDISDDPTEFVYLQGEATSRPVTPAQSPQMQQNTKHTTNHLQQQPLSQAAAAAAAAPSKPPKPTVASAATAGATTGSGDAGATGSSSGVGAADSVGIETVTGKAHGGMLRGAECMLDSCGVGEAMDLLVEHGYHKITIVGHSLGGGTAALVAMMLKTRYAQKYVLMPSTCPTAAMQISASMPSILAVTYGTPAVVSPTLADAVNEDKLMISVVNKSDLVPRISMANIFALADEVVAYRPQAEQHMSRDYEEYRERFVTGGRTRNRKTTAAAAAAADTPQPMPNERVPAATATATVPTAVPLNNNNNTTIGAPPRDTFDFATVHSIIPETNVTSRTNVNDDDDDVHGDNSNSSSNSSNNRQSHQLGSGRGANGAGEAQMQAAVQESVNNEIGGVLSSLEAMPDASLARLVVPGRIVDLHPDLQGSGRMTATVYDYSSHPSLSSIKMTSSCLDDHKIENYLYSLRNMRLSREMQGDARLKPRYKRRPVWEPALHTSTGSAGREGRGSGALLSEIALSSGLEAAACWRQCNVCSDDCTTVFTTSGISARAHSMVNCRACGRIVCLACAPAGDEIPAEGISQKQKLRDFRIPLPSLGLIEPQRVCMPCYYNSYFI
mmetsp:Transcript_29667/g.50082  ORF Transcript_29667/g.50082 Transcript_29667/m.50082 type:complete len:1391 (+) Transcript_29667:294-4466(+)